VAEESQQESTDVVETIRERMTDALVSHSDLSKLQVGSVVAYLLSGERLAPDKLLEMLAVSEGSADADS